MKIEIVAIGNEVLSGITVNSNATFISAELLKLGFIVSRHTVLPDDPLILHEGLAAALERNKLVITTGGLGPTFDDITREIAAELFHSDFRFDEELAADLQRRYGDRIKDTLQNQATVPTKAIVLKNSVGTAPGSIFHENGKTLIMLPGVPLEMKTMMKEGVVPYLQKHFVDATRKYLKKMHMFGISEAQIDPIIRSFQKQNPDMEFGIYPGQGVVDVHFIVKAKNEAEAEEFFKEPYKILKDKFHANVFESPSGKLEEAIHHAFINKKITLAAAESCTGGNFAARLVRLPGASKYFLGSIVCYSDLLKHEFLGVPNSILKDTGAVSEETVRSMLSGLFTKTQCDYGVAVTGIAGPDGGTKDKPVGTVWCAVGTRNHEPKVWKLGNAYGNRDTIIERSVNALYGALLKEIGL